jgi:hypothetical protein
MALNFLNNPEGGTISCPLRLKKNQEIFAGFVLRLSFYFFYSRIHFMKRNIPSFRYELPFVSISENFHECPGKFSLFLSEEHKLNFSLNCS